MPEITTEARGPGGSFRPSGHYEFTDEDEIVSTVEKPLIPTRPLRPCKGCGTLTRRGWCSNSCFVAEDGPPDDMYDDDYDQPDREDED